MRLEPGTALKQYRITGLLGKGGMGEVYVADDTRLGRKVAIKILPEGLAGDAERLRRFTLEAKTASGLNHPSILTIYDVDEVDGQPFLVSEFIEGQTLRERLRRGGLSLREAVEIAGQVASALSAAHAVGIVHRDVKPENIMLRDDGHAKLLDFGLAKIARDAAGSSDETMTAVELRTTPGVVMGTTAYMSPEQARGLEVDARSDIFSLGVVLYEMAAGRPPFQGETPSDVIAAILRVEPPAIADLPPELEHTLRKALEKDGDERHQTAKDLAADLKRLRRRLDHSASAPASMGQGAAAWAATPGSGASAPGDRSGSGAAAASGAAAHGTVRASHGESRSPAVAPASTRRWLILAAVAMLVVIGVFAFASRGRWLDGRTGDRGSIGTGNFTGMTIEKVSGLGRVFSPSLSPDGKLLAYVTTEGADTAIWLRQMATGSVVRVVGPTPNNISGLQFTPDNNFLYYNERPPVRPFRYTLMAVPAFGGAAREIAEGRFGRVSFSPDGKRLAVVRDRPAAWELVVMSADGAHTSSVIATRPKSEGLFSSVSWSPAGEELALVSQSGPNLGQVLQLMKPDGTLVRTLTVSGTPPPFLLDIAWTAGPDALLARAVEQTGRDPHPQLLLIRTSDGHLEPVTNDASRYGDLSFSPGSGAIATIQTTMLGSTWIGPAAQPEEAKELPGRLTDNDGLSGLTWVNDRQLVFTRKSGTASLWMMNDDGTGARRLASLDSILRPTASRDGSLILFDGFRVAEGTQAVYRLDLPAGRATEVTLGEIVGAPTLSPDGRRVFFMQGRETPPARVLSMPLDGGTATTVFEAPMVFDHAVSRDGAQIAVIANTGVGTPRTISLLPAGGGPARTIFTTTASVDHVRWYPSGDALVLRMIEKGQSNIYRLEVAGGAAHQLTHFTRGEAQYPDISPDGRRIAYFRDTREFDIVLLKPKIE